MNTINIFEAATRMKLRFPFKGSITVEDLWDLSLTDLDTIYKKLNAQAKASQEESLLGTRRATDVTVEVQIEIIKHIVQCKLTARDEARAATERKAKREKLLAALASKEEQALDSMTADELKRALAEIDVED